MISAKEKLRVITNDKENELSRVRAEINKLINDSGEYNVIYYGIIPEMLIDELSRSYYYVEHKQVGMNEYGYYIGWNKVDQEKAEQFCKSKGLKMIDEC